MVSEPIGPEGVCAIAVQRAKAQASSEEFKVPTIAFMPKALCIATSTQYFTFARCVVPPSSNKRQHHPHKTQAANREWLRELCKAMQEEGMDTVNAMIAHLIQQGELQRTRTHHTVQSQNTPKQCRSLCLVARHWR